ncbi:MAG: NAD(P)/FAD-dependent oxidoreductase, partial [Myxococcota bacterium]
WDLIIIGAGAAGIGAGITARAAGLSAKVFEAAPRIGGRAYTASLGGLPFDVGCHYLHHVGANPFASIALARQLPMRFDLPSLPSAGVLVRNGQRRPEPEREALEDYFEASFDVLEDDEALDDVALSERLDTSSPHYPLLRAWFAAHYGSPPERMSALDLWRHEDTPYDWPVSTGYGALIAGLGTDLDVALDVPVTEVRRVRGGVEVVTDQGTATSKAVLVTVSTEVLRAGAILFTPGLPDAVTTALDGVRLGHAERVGFRTQGRLVGEDFPLGAHVEFGDGQALQLYLHEFGDPLVTVYLAGEVARDLATEGSDAIFEVAEQAIVDVVGGDARSELGERVTSGWTIDPRILGGYSIVLPGRAHARETLAEPFDGRIRLAGEACSIAHFGTAHGAWATGIEQVNSWIEEGLLIPTRST